MPWTDILTLVAHTPLSLPSMFRRHVMVTVLPAAGTVELGPTGPTAATGSSPCGSRGWHRRPPGGSYCQSNGQSSSGSQTSWSHKHSPASQKQKKTKNKNTQNKTLQLEGCPFGINVIAPNSSYNPGKENLAKKTWAERSGQWQCQHWSWLFQIRWSVARINLSKHYLSWTESRQMWRNLEFP